MQDNSESFRNELICKLFPMLPQDRLKSVVDVLDSTLAEYAVSRRTTDIIPADGVPETVRYFIASKYIGNLSGGTLKIYRLRLNDFFSFMCKPLADITTMDIRLYLGFCKSERSASDSYLDAIRRILNSFFSWAVANSHILRNPCAGVEPIKHQTPEREPLSSYEIEVLRWHCESVREKALVDFLFSTGLRISECHDVNLSDIDWNARSVVIRHGKGNKRRIVYFNAESELTLRKYIESRRDSNDALFVTSRRPYRRLCVKGLQNIISKIANRCDMHVYPHKLRHTFATFGLRGGMPVDQLQQLMGHAKPETTLIYAKHDTADLRRAHTRIYA